MTARLPEFDPNQFLLPPPQPPQDGGGGGWGGAIWGRVFGYGAQQGANYAQAHQAELAATMRNVMTAALLQDLPPDLQTLRTKLASILDFPTLGDMREVYRLLRQLPEVEIRRLNPHLNATGLTRFLNLQNILGRVLDRVENAPDAVRPVGALPVPIFEDGQREILNATISDVAGLIDLIGEHQRGVLPRAMHRLAAEAARTAISNLQGTMQLITQYRAQLARGERGEPLLRTMQNLEEALERLVGDRAHVPQIPAENWAWITSFIVLIREQRAAPAVLPATEALQHELLGPYTLIQAAYREQSGSLHQGADVVQSTVGGILRRAEEVPAHVAQGVAQAFGVGPNPAAPAAAAAPAAVPAGAAAAPAAAAGPMNYTLEQMRTRLEGAMRGIGDTLVDTVSQQAAGSVASLLNYIVTQITTHVGANPELQPVLLRIQPVMERVRAAQRSRSWGELTGAIGDCLAVMREQEVYFQGLRIPIHPTPTNNSPIPGLLEILNGHQEALREQPPPVQQVTPAMTQAMQERVKVRSSALTTMSMVISMWGMEGIDTFEILRSPPNEDTKVAQARFRQGFFERVNGSRANAVSKWLAKRAYDLLHFFSALYLHSIIDGMTKSYQDWMNDGTDPIWDKEKMIVGRVRNWLSVTSGVYTEAARAAPAQRRDFLEMLEAGINAPQRNGGLSQQELYAAFLRNLLEQYSPRARWSERISAFFDQTCLPQNSSWAIFYPIVYALNFFTKWTLIVCVCIPQYLINFVLRKGATTLVGSQSVLQAAVSEQTEAMRRPTPTSFALMRILYEQLRRMSTSIQAQAAAPTQTRLANARQVELSALFEALFELLHKSRYLTADRLERYLEGRLTVRERLEHELDELLLPQTIDAGVFTLATAFETVLQPDQMTNALYELLNLADYAMDPTVPVSPEQVAGLERGIREMIDRILQSTIFYALGDRFDFNNTRQREAIERFIEALRQDSFSLVRDLHQRRVELRRDLEAGTFFVGQQLTEMIRASMDYQTARLGALREIDGHGALHTATRICLNAECRAQVTHVTPVAASLNALKHGQDERESALDAWQLMQTLQRDIDGLRVLLSTPRAAPGDEIFIERSFAVIRQRIARLTTFAPDLARDLTAMVEGDTGLCRLAENMERCRRSQDALLDISVQTHQIAQIKLHSPASPDIRLWVVRTFERISALSPSLHRDELQRMFTQFSSPLSTQATAQVARSFSTLHAASFAENASRLTEARAGWARITQDMQQRLVSESQRATNVVAQNRDTMLATLQALEGHLNALDAHTQEIRPIHLVNLFVGDMQWVVDTLQSVAFARAQATVDEMVNALYQRHNYLGLVQQVVVLPHLQTHGSHHLRTS